MRVRRLRRTGALLSGLLLAMAGLSCGEPRGAEVQSGPDRQRSPVTKQTARMAPVGASANPCSCSKRIEPD